MGSHMSSRSLSAACERSARALEAPPPPFPAHTERASSPPSAAALAYLRGRDADGRMQSLIVERAALRPVLGLLALRLVKRRAYETLAFRSLGDYARERLGVTAQALREWSRVWEALAGLPQLRAGVLSSEISWSVARRAVAHASPETDEAFAAALRGRTVCAAEAMLHAAFPDAPTPETDPAERVRVCVPLPAVQQGLWLAALELVRRTAGEALPVWECAEFMAAEALGVIPPGLDARAVGAGRRLSAHGATLGADGAPLARPAARWPTRLATGSSLRSRRLSSRRPCPPPSSRTPSPSRRG